MQLINTVAVSAVVLSGYAAAQSALMVNTPGSLFQCQPALLSWTGGVAPYYPRINAAGSTTNTLEMLPTTNSTSYTWTVNEAEGTIITFAVTDSTGAAAYSGQSPAIGTGTSTCLGSSASVSGATSSTSAASGSSTSAGSSSSAATTSRASSSSSGSSSRASSSTSSAAASSSSTTSDSPANVRGFAAVVAGSVGVVVAALL